MSKMAPFILSSGSDSNFAFSNAFSGSCLSSRPPPWKRPKKLRWATIFILPMVPSAPGSKPAKALRVTVGAQPSPHWTLAPWVIRIQLPSMVGDAFSVRLTAVAREPRMRLPRIVPLEPVSAMPLAALPRIAFPAISTGVFGYPVEEAAEVALKAVMELAPTLRYVKRIRFVLFSNEALRIHEAVFAMLLSEAAKEK